MDEFEMVEKALGPVVEIEEHVSSWRMPATFASDYKRIGDYIARHGADCVDMPYARYLDMNWEVELNRSKVSTIFMLFTKKWHFYAGMPSSKLLPGEAEIESRTLAGQHYVRAVHRGPYEECTSTYRALYDWAKAQNLSLQNESIECYVNDPREVDKADIETVILIPLIE